MTDIIARLELRLKLEQAMGDEPYARDLADALAEVRRLMRENDWMRAYTGQSAKACVYCGLGADEQGKCERGFPGCARADDQLLCREVAVAVERDALRAEVEQLKHAAKKA